MIAYIVAAYLWWMILLLNRNNESFLTHTTVAYKDHILQNKEISFEDFKKTSVYLLINKEYKNQEWMILGEGSVFLFLILILSWRVIRSFKNEINLNRAQKNFLLSVTHELKSPLASVKLSLQTLESRQNIDKDKKSKLLGNALYDVERLQGMVDNLLLSARFESDSFHIDTHLINLSALIESISDRVHYSTGINHKIALFIESDIYVNGDETALTSVIENLIDNAIKYSSSCTALIISLKQTDSSAILTITDEGIGISNAEKSKIFEKFYRIGNEETRKTKGSGLGLYIVNQFVSLHKGRIKVLDNMPCGTSFEITFPKTNRL